MILTSPNFKNNEKIPARFTGDGENINPELEIKDIPNNAKSLVLIVDDPDAPIGNWTHWVVFNIPVNNENKIIKENSTPGVQGKNTSGRINYIGPKPPFGTHRYFFKIFALDIKLNLKEGANKQEIEDEMKGHILEKSELVGLYR